MTKRAGTWIRIQLNIYIVEDVHSILAETYEHIDWTYTYQIEILHTTRFGMWLKHVRTTQDSNGWTSFDLGPLKASWLRQENTGKVPKKSVPVTLSTAAAHGKSWSCEHFRSLHKKISQYLAVYPGWVDLTQLWTAIPICRWFIYWTWLCSMAMVTVTKGSGSGFSWFHQSSHHFRAGRLDLDWRSC